jgi:hypothetical protein
MPVAEELTESLTDGFGEFRNDSEIIASSHEV